MQARLFSFTFWVQLHLCVCHLQFYLKAHSDELRLTHATVADSCVSAEIVNFLILHLATFFGSRMRQTRHV